MSKEEIKKEVEEVLTEQELEKAIDEEFAINIDEPEVMPDVEEVEKTPEPQPVDINVELPPQVVQLEQPPKAPDLFKKLNRIQCELKAPKNQKNSFGGYNYRSCEDILEALKPLLQREGLNLYLSDELVNIGERYYVRAVAEITDGIHSKATFGLAREEEVKKGMDGSQITGASSSYARKYALNGLFLIDDNKDSDSTNTGDKKPAKATTAPKTASTATTTAPEGALKCIACESTITFAEKKYSESKLGKALCRACQAEVRSAS